MDDRLARRAAIHLGLQPLGVIGILVQAKRNGLLPSIGPLLEAMQQRVGFRLSQQLIRRALLDVGEIDA